MHRDFGARPQLLASVDASVRPRLTQIRIAARHQRPAVLHCVRAQGVCSETHCHTTSHARTGEWDLGGLQPAVCRSCRSFVYRSHTCMNFKRRSRVSTGLVTIQAQHRSTDGSCWRRRARRLLARGADAAASPGDACVRRLSRNGARAA
eukprot:6205568-Pleurochrysis_carterae.AAC.2